MKTLKLCLSTLLLTCLLTVSAVSAGPKDGQIGRDQAIAIVKEQFEGKVLKVQLKEQPRSSFYRVKLLTKSGRVRIFRVDSRSGAVLKGDKP